MKTTYMNELRTIHGYLMYKGFPYHSVSVIYRENDLGLHVMFMDSVREKVTDEIRGYLTSSGFGISYVRENDTYGHTE